MNIILLTLNLENSMKEILYSIQFLFKSAVFQAVALLQVYNNTLRENV